MRKRECPIITLTTDFGLRDGYVAAMKGVMLQIAPQAVLVDVTHEVDRHAVLPGAFVLRDVLRWYPPETVHVAVVDPGVGSARRIIAARLAGQYLVAPDNGLISLAHQDFPIEQVHVVENPSVRLPQVSATFHGRDIMAPAAAHLANGATLDDLGRPTDHVEILPTPRPRRLADNSLAGQAIYADVFGNLTTNIGQADLAALRRLSPNPSVTVQGQSLGPVRRTYSDVAAGESLALIGSGGMLEIAVHAGSAAERFGPIDDLVVTVR